jgi:hypothetical protein
MLCGGLSLVFLSTLSFIYCANLPLPFILTTFTITFLAFYYLYSRTDFATDSYCFTLGEVGDCQFSTRKKQSMMKKETKTEPILFLQISPESRVGFIGFWLVFIDEGMPEQYQVEKRKKYRKFIFKDSLSNKDHARLSRTVLRVKHASRKQLTI